MGADVARILAEPECRTCEDWGTIVVFDAQGRPVRTLPCPTHIGSVPVRAAALDTGRPRCTEYLAALAAAADAAERATGPLPQPLWRFAVPDTR